MSGSDMPFGETYRFFLPIEISSGKLELMGSKKSSLGP